MTQTVAADAEPAAATRNNVQSTAQPWMCVTSHPSACSRVQA
jgi:hypothetical protein